MGRGVGLPTQESALTASIPYLLARIQISQGADRLAEVGQEATLWIAGESSQAASLLGRSEVQAVRVLGLCRPQ